MSDRQRDKRTVDVVHQQACAVQHRSYQVVETAVVTQLRRQLLAELTKRQVLRPVVAVTNNLLSGLRKKGSIVVYGRKLGLTLLTYYLTCSSVLRLAA